MESQEPEPEPEAEPEPKAQPTEPPAKKPRAKRAPRKKKEDVNEETPAATEPSAASSEPKPTKATGIGAVQLDAKFFAGLSTTLRQLHRAERVAKLSWLAIV